MTILLRGAPALLALLVLPAGACSSQTINLLNPPPGDGGAQPTDAAVGRSDAGAELDAGATPDTGPALDAGLAPDGSGASGGCPEVIDQRLGDCMSPPVGPCGGYTEASAGGGELLQVITPALDGAIIGLRLWARTNEPTNARVRVSIADLRDDPLAVFDPLYSIDAHLLASGVSAMTASFGWQSVALSSPANVRAGHPYAIHVQMAPASPGSVDWGLYSDLQHPSLDPYPGGRAFGVTSIGWVEDPVFEDFLFEVRMIPAICP